MLDQGFVHLFGEELCADSLGDEEGFLGEILGL